MAVVWIRPAAVLLASVVVFCVVQDRGTSAGVGRYIAAHRASAAGTGPMATIDEVMRPAVRESVRSGLVWSGAVAAVGVAGVVATRRRSGRG